MQQLEAFVNLVMSYARCLFLRAAPVPRASLLERLKFPPFGLSAVEKMDRITNHGLVTALADKHHAVLRTAWGTSTASAGVREFPCPVTTT